MKTPVLLVLGVVAWCAIALLIGSRVTLDSPGVTLAIWGSSAVPVLFVVGHLALRRSRLDLNEPRFRVAIGGFRCGAFLVLGVWCASSITPATLLQWAPPLAFFAMAVVSGWDCIKTLRTPSQQPT